MKISSSPRSYRSPQRAKRGIALVLVLAFVVILTVLALAFLSRALLNQQISVSSSSRVKVDIFAQGALKTILGDLNDEIVAGSRQTVPGASGYTYTMSQIDGLTSYNNINIYIPNTPATVIPAVSLPTSICNTSLGSSTFLIPYAPDLVKMSYSNQPFFPNSSSSPYEGVNSAGVVVTPQPSNRACNVDTSVASLNGRSISPAIWNKALLLPKNTPSSTTDFTPPTADFTNPDWVLVARDGSNPGSGGSTPTFGPTTNGTVNNRAQSNSKYVVGRYAYMIYDEGGLLDANAVGRPAGTPPSIAPNNQGYNYQNSEAFVDLTQSPFSLSSTAINNLVGWRNYASAGTSGNFPSLTPTLTTYYNNILFNPAGVSSTNPFGFVTGFLTPAVNLVGSSVANNQTDRMFASRQQLIDFFNACDTTSTSTLATCQNMLQYLTHFSRDLEQPLIIPRPDRPKIVDKGYPAGAQNSQGNSESPAASGGGNFGNDTDNPGDPFNGSANIPYSYVNPDFLEVQATLFGPPVTIKRFPLNRLALLTSSATGNGADLIYQYFGLKRSASATGDTSNDAVNSIWIYDHGPDPKNLQTGGRILTIAEVAQLTPPRAPDFFEMLKGAISVGSLGRSADPGLASTISQSEVLLDNDVDYQILQIGANLIDQYKADNLPTRITPSNNISGGTVGDFRVVFSGDEDLPYLYRLRAIPVLTTAPLFPLNRYATSGPNNTNGTEIVVPEVWNPHMQNLNDSSLTGPVKFRIWISGTVYTDTSMIDKPRPNETVTVQEPQGGTPSAPISWPIGQTWPTGTDPDTSATGNDVINFQSTPNAVSTTNFRQPTLLIDPSQYGINETGPNHPVTDYKGVTLAGFPYGIVYWAYNTPQGVYVQSEGTSPQTTNGITVHLDYFNPSTSKWVEYQNIYTDTTNVEAGYYRSYINSTNYQYGHYSLYDPRTARWNMLGANNGASYLSSDPSTTGLPDTFTTQQDGTSQSGTGLWCYGPQSTAFDTSYNDPLPNAVYQGSFQQNFLSNGHLDADGVNRPAMGLLASGTTGLPLAGPPNSNPTGWTSRPVILHRPFRSVAEMAYAFSGTPWTNIDFTNPSSGSANLLEAFCLNESDRADGMVAGRVNLNTRQQPVLAALFNGAYVDEFGSIPPIATTAAQSLAATLTSRTESTSLTTGLGPLESRAELVGRLVTGGNSPTLASQPTYSGFVNDRRTPSGTGLNSSLDVSSALSANNIPYINRWSESAIRGLADVGTARTWNLMIDIIAQTGQYPPNAASAANFQVEGQKRYWLHVAIDRFTGKIIDQQLEPVVQ